MITKWEVSNFKSIREKTELELGPLTIFAGANSSGKSTFIQSILLVAQTLAHKVSSRSVVLNGALSSLGQFDDLKSSGGEINQISIKCTCRPLSNQDGPNPRSSQITARMASYYSPLSNQLKEITCEMAFDAEPSSPQRDLLQIQPRLFSTQLSCISRDDDNKANISIHRSSKVIAEIEGADRISESDDQLRVGLAYAVELDKNSMEEVKEDFRSAKPIGCMLKHFLPEQIIYQIDTIHEDAKAITIALEDLPSGSSRNIRGDILLSEEIIEVLTEIFEEVTDLYPDPEFYEYQELLFGPEFEKITFREWHRRLLNHLHHDILFRGYILKVQGELQEQDLFDRIYAAMKASTAEKQEPHAFVQKIPPSLIEEATWYLDNFFTSSLKYLGPLRDNPKPLYPLAPAADLHDVGLRGEHTASILELHKSKKIQYIPSTNLETPIVKQKTVTATLEEAVIDWLKYLDVASSVESRDQGKLGHELKVGLANSNSIHDLTHVGVGVSQVLPILVMCLLADSDSTLVFEQPELHLHPKVQTLLGDFFLSMALCNKQCIVETHSEYFINRLRFRIAAASSDKELNSQTKIYFVEKTTRGSSFREVIINEYGAISEWPEGFFDQSQQQAEEILRSAAMKRKASRKNKNA